MRPVSGPIENRLMKETDNEIHSAAPGYMARGTRETKACTVNGMLLQGFTSWPGVWAACVRRTHGWRTPPRWSPRDWLEEIDAESIASACQAILIFEPDRGPSLESFLYHRILAGALARYRKEWSYAFRCGRRSSSGDDAFGTKLIDDQDAAAVERQKLMGSMTALPEDDRRLIECLYWDGHTERDVAGRLGITQQAVSKRKRKILLKLRENLANSLRP
jgi:RNA polymerase sigma factor (sigma-70 family)